MSHTYTSLLIHAVWSTKKRQPLITKEVKPRLYGYLHNALDKKGVKLMHVNGMEDHVHLLLSMPLTVLIPDLFETIKPAATKWVHKTFPGMRDFGWQTGYGAFSVGRSNMQQVINYIANQEEHHRTVTFQEEFIRLLEMQGISYDKRFVFD